MARIPTSNDGTKWEVTILTYDVSLIKNPGSIGQEIVIKFDGRYSPNYERAKEDLLKVEGLEQDQLLEIVFWFGFFYGYLVRL